MMRARGSVRVAVTTHGTRVRIDFFRRGTTKMLDTWGADYDDSGKAQAIARRARQLAKVMTGENLLAAGPGVLE